MRGSMLHACVWTSPDFIFGISQGKYEMYKKSAFVNRIILKPSTISKFSTNSLHLTRLQVQQSRLPKASVEGLEYGSIIRSVVRDALVDTRHW